MVSWNTCALTWSNLYPKTAVDRPNWYLVFQNYGKSALEASLAHSEAKKQAIYWGGVIVIVIYFKFQMIQ
jgi:hypothetical protein